ncbi:MAG: outer membrane protein assembly factor BamD [Aestuariivirgaceae bacterium]
MLAETARKTLQRKQPLARIGVVWLGLFLAGCSGDTGYSGLGDYVWGGGGDSSSAEGTSVSSGDAVAPDLSGIEDGKPIAELYNDALDKLKDERYEKAAKGLGEVERQHPYSQWATRAILMQAYAHYQDNDYDAAQNAAQRFITLHPGHRDAPYAYYLVAISHYEQISDVKRDQSETKKALASLEEISQRFPGTSYARDAEAKAVLARDHLAGKEMEIGRYYLRKQSHLSGINRFKAVVTNYQTTTHTPEALYRLTEAYLALGIRSEAQTAAAVLGHNYPNSDWYRDAFSLLNGQGLAPVENKSSWISKAVSSINPF